MTENAETQKCWNAEISMSGSTFEYLSDPLEHSATKHPDSQLLDEYGRSVSYRELNAAANRIANILKKRGVQPGDRVGLCLPKSINSVACLQGALKARACYVPADYSAPAQRNHFIFDNCDAKVICTDEPRAKALTDAGTPSDRLLVFAGKATDGIGAPWMNDASDQWKSDKSVSPDDLAYILYTSGSTGVPKGVMHSHRSALSFVLWSRDTFQPTNRDTFSSHAPFHFDLSILDLYVPLTVGANLIIVGEDLGKDPALLAPFIAEKKITIWYSVPSILAMMAQYGKLDQHDYSSLRTVLFAGEVFPIKHLKMLKEQWRTQDYYNLYGPTETNVCTYYKLPNAVEPDRTQPYPIGITCENCRDAVLDENLKDVAEGQSGVLYMHRSGPVMLGYWARDDLNSKVFITRNEEKWFCTGDVVHKALGGVEDGNYIFEGRRDRMVKRRGYRIELGEIEAALYRHEQVREAAAIATENTEGVTVTVFLSAKGDAKLSIIALKQFSMKNLPNYMIPDRFMFLENLPRTSTDKVAYQELKSLAEAGQTAAAAQ